MELLEALFAHNGIRAASVSIDDFYLTFADQQALAQVFPPALRPVHACEDMRDTFRPLACPSLHRERRQAKSQNWICV